MGLLERIPLFGAYFEAKYQLRILEHKYPDDEELNSQAKFWNNRKLKAVILYSARPVFGGRERVDWPVQYFINPNDPVIKFELEMNKLMVKNPFNCDDDIVKIYKYVRTNPSLPYVYSQDVNQFYVNEVWMFPPEMRVLKQGDCDDWAGLLCSYLIAAGVPSYRVRFTAGTTNDGQGHATVYVLMDDHKRWKHINSTAPFANPLPDVLDLYPSSNDANDKLGIHDCWFSFNDKNSWAEFETSATAGKYKKSKWAKFYKILR